MRFVSWFILLSHGNGVTIKVNKWVLYCFNLLLQLLRISRLLFCKIIKKLTKLQPPQANVRLRSSLTEI